MNLLEIANDSIDILKKHSPKILLGSGIACGALAVVASSIASFKASDIIYDIHSNKKLKNDKKALAKEYLTKVVPLYIPVLILETGSIVCLVKSYDINAKRLAAATALAEVSVETLRLYKDKAREVLGEEKVKELEEKVKEEEKAKDEANSTGEHWYNYDLQWFRDSLTGQEFLATVNDITKANLALSDKLQYEMSVSLNDWLDILKDHATQVGDIPQVGPIPDGTSLGWTQGQIIHVYTNKLEKTKVGNHPCIELTYSTRPFEDYRKLYYRTSW